jgi:hypothetical protein
VPVNSVSVDSVSVDSPLVSSANTAEGRTGDPSNSRGRIRPPREPPDSDGVCGAEVHARTEE